MSTSSPSGTSSLGKRVLAAAILLVVAILLFKFVVGLLATLLWIVVAVVGIAAVVWALRVL